MLSFCHQSLGLSADRHTQPKSDHPAIDSFRGTGEALCRRYTRVQRQKFYDACSVTMEGYRTEQRMRMAGHVPTVEEYWGYRDGACCMHMCIALIELGIGSSIPADVLNSSEMNDLWFETSCANWITNDILSAKKEMAEDYVENIVPLCAEPTRKCQDGLDRAVVYLEEHLRLFDDKAKALEEKFSDRTERSDDSNGHVDGEANGVNGHGDANGLHSAARRRGPAADMTVAEQVSLFIKSCKMHAAGSWVWGYVLF